MPTPVMFLLLESDSRRRLLESESTYRSAFASREVLRAVDCPCITDNPFFFAATFGYDNRTLLPPFMPVLRAEDDIFGFTVRACIEDGYFGHLPTAVFHSPVDTRAYSHEFTIQQMEGYLQHYRRVPAFWAKDVDNYLHHFHTALISENFVVPKDLLGSRNADEARKLSQQLVFKFGQLLYYWPELVTAARTLRDRERRLSVAHWRK